MVSIPNGTRTVWYQPCPPGNGDRNATWRWIVHLRRRVQSLEREVDMGKGEMIRIARVAAGA